MAYTRYSIYAVARKNRADYLAFRMHFHVVQLFRSSSCRFIKCPTYVEFLNRQLLSSVLMTSLLCRCWLVAARKTIVCASHACVCVLRKSIIFVLDHVCAFIELHLC